MIPVTTFVEIIGAVVLVVVLAGGIAVWRDRKLDE